MSEKGKGGRSGKAEKSDQRLKKPIKAIKKLKDHFHKLSKKNTTEKTNGGLPRSIEPTKYADMSRAIDASRATTFSRSVESSRPVGAFRNADVTQNAETSHIVEPTRNVDQFRSSEALRSAMEELHVPDTSRNASADVTRNTDMSRVVEATRGTDLLRNMEKSRSMEMTHNAALLNDQKSPPEKTATSPPHRPTRTDSMLNPELSQPSISTEDIRVLKANSSEKPEDNDTAVEQQLASLDRRLKTLVDENEKANKREEQLFVTKNQILAKIELVKKQMDEAMDQYRGEAQGCREKIEKEEIFQNQMLMDLKERVEKLSDMCTDINNQVDDMTATLNAYSVSESGVFYMVAACSVDLVVRFFQCILSVIIFITRGSPQTLPTATVTPAPAATSETNDNKN